MRCVCDISCYSLLAWRRFSYDYFLKMFLSEVILNYKNIFAQNQLKRHNLIN